MLLAFSRCVGVVLLAPPVAHAAVPARLRVMVAVVMGIAVLGRMSGPAEVVGLRVLVPAVGMELLLGMVIGLSARLVVVGAELAAEHAAQQMGVGLADALAPSMGQAGAPLRRLFGLIAVVVFVGAGGAEALAGGLMGSFDVLPAGEPGAAGGLLATAVAVLGTSFSLGLKLAGPMLTAMLLATVAMGLLQRAIPQCNMLSMGLPVRAMLGLIVLAGTVTLLAGVLETAFAGAMDDLRGMLGRQAT